MENKKLVTWIIALVLAVLCISGVFFFLFKVEDKIPEPEGPYPVLEPNEKLPNIGAPWVNYSPEKPVFKFGGPFPKMPSKMIVYKIVRPQNITEAHVREVIEKCFGLPPDAKMSRSSPRPGGLALYWLKTQTHLFEFEPDTGFFNIFKYEKARQKRSNDRKDFPSDEQCKRIATEYLKERGLLPEDAYLSGVGDNTSAGVMSVAFRKKIDGYKCWGPGAQILVNMGPVGEIVQVIKNWVELEPWKMAPIKTPKEALKELKSGRAFMGRHSGKITKISLRYDTPSGLAPYAQPVYWFDCSGPSGRDFYAAVPAIKTEYLK